MNRKEVLDFLELPDSATDQEIQVRMSDKLTYFQRLSENAPNEFLRKLHTTNTEKIKLLQSQMAGTNSSHAAPSSRPQPAYAPHESHQPAPAARKTEVAWLVRHTEQQSAKTFPLYYGKNYIGRNPHSQFPTIVIEEDPYVSRVHALIEIININPLQAVISDEAASNGGKPSKNGTYINGDARRLSQKIMLNANDTIQVGTTKFIIRSNNTSIQKIVQEVEESEYMKTVVIDLF